VGLEDAQFAEGRGAALPIVGGLAKLRLDRIAVWGGGPETLLRTFAPHLRSLSYTWHPMDDTSGRLLHVFSELEDIAQGMTPEEARGSLEEPTLQLFWRQWPQVSSWAGSLWRLLNEDTIDPAASASGEFDEVGGSG
jgi:hypothetical protein